MVNQIVPEQSTLSEDELRPRLAPGVELLGACQDGELEAGTHLYRRPDGQVVQVSHLLHLVAAALDGERSTDDVADEVSARIGRRLSPEGVSLLVDQKLRPLGLVAQPDDQAVAPAPPPLALRIRAGVLPVRVVRAVAGVLQPLFSRPVMLIVVAAVAAVDAWLLLTRHSLTESLQVMLLRPTNLVAVAGLMALGGAFHEFGHATACRYGGGRPGRIGFGLYLIWPVFYSDVTDSWRLDRRGRVRTDLGGVYFNLVFVLCAALAYAASDWGPLLAVIVFQHAVVLQQFLPFVRLDGYYLLGDLLGVPDLFSYVRPVLLSALPGRAPDKAVLGLRPRIRRAVVLWVVITTALLVAAVALMVARAPTLVTTTAQSLAVHWRLLETGVNERSPVATLAALLQTAALLLPLIAIALTGLLAATRLSRWRRERRQRTHGDREPRS